MPNSQIPVAGCGLLKTAPRSKSTLLPADQLAFCAASTGAAGPSKNFPEPIYSNPENRYYACMQTASQEMTVNLTLTLQPGLEEAHGQLLQEQRQWLESTRV